MVTEKKIVCYHLFGDNWDEWYSTRKEAELVYKRMVDEADGQINIRLYKTWSYENDEESEEEYIRGRGQFPW